MTYKLAPGVKPHDAPEPPANKDRYIAAKTVIPAIALKKAKQAMNQKPADAATMVGILGAAECTCYRVTKPYAEKMILGSLEKYAGQFWRKVSDHLKKTPIGVIVLPTNSPYSIEEATCLNSRAVLYVFPAISEGCYVNGMLC